MIAKHLILFYVFMCVSENWGTSSKRHVFDSNYGVDCVRIVEKDEKRGATIEIRSPTWIYILNVCAWHLASFRKCSKSKAINENDICPMWIPFYRIVKSVRFLTFSLWQKYDAICHLCNISFDLDRIRTAGRFCK